MNFDTCPLVLSMIEEIIEHANESGKNQGAASKLDALLSFMGTIFRNKEQHLKVLHYVSEEVLNGSQTSLLTLVFFVFVSLRRTTESTFKKCRKGALPLHSMLAL